MIYKKHFLSYYYLIKSYPRKNKWIGENRVFCLSLQKTGTTSTGDFFDYFGFPIVRSDLAQLRKWNELWYYENYSKIFNDPVFKNNQVFEDAPFWALDFYKVLYSKFPDAKFVLFTRDPNDWFESLINHGKGNILGDKAFHSKNYKRPDAIDPSYSLKDNRDYYIDFYQQRNKEIINFFKLNQSKNFFHAELEDPMKWLKLAEFMNIKTSSDIEFKSNVRK